MKLSIIIPVYNISSYIERCVQSCLNQDLDYADYEIIVVNDGSTDNSLSVIKPFAEKYKNVTIITQNNKGLSGARNTGLTVANGDYIWFVDGDDWIKENCLKELTDYASHFDCDILAFDAFVITDDNKQQTSKIVHSESPAMRGLDFLKLNILEGVWNNFFSRKLLITHKLEFVEGLIHEDAEFNIRAFSFAQNLVYLPGGFYFYISDRESSIMNVMTLKRAISPIEITSRYMNFIEEIGLKNPDSMVISKKGCIQLNISIIYAAQLNESDRFYYFEEIKRNRRNLCKCLLYSFSPRYWIQSIGLFLFPKVSILLTWKLRKFLGKL